MGNVVTGLVMKVGARLGQIGQKMVFALKRIGRDRAANVAVMFALSAPAILGGVGIALEMGNWYFNQREMQNAADAAAIAAATNGTATYSTEANAVTANYGFTNGTNGVVVTASNAAACPAGGNNCYSVTISKPVPLYLAPLVGFSGDKAGSQTLQGSATAATTSQPVSLCLLALSTVGTSLLTNGAPKANMSGCNVMANGSANCNGHNLGATYGLAHHSDNGCGITQESNVPVVPDPYAAMAANIPANPCKNYGYESNGNPTTWTGNVNLSSASPNFVCGDLQLTGNATINTTGGGASVLVVENGQVDTGTSGGCKHGCTLQTANGSQVTIIFSGDNTYTGPEQPTGGGTLNIQAPTSGTWGGVAVYDDPKLSDGSGQLDIAAAGNSPTWDISGLVYLPNSSVTFSGAVNKSANGQSCFTMVVDTILINGTGSILDAGDCAGSGLNQPVAQVPGRGVLVL